ncbi:MULTISPECIES: hypothetical protein [unclassified Streptomyces]|uniref:hypothetical protein n=1 Tax=unclassified Streptomyces TaxID=2593676 RepID=UPI0025B5C1AE|nr:MULTISPECIES: hypothetical protein [unclassified Streptomyces]MDN3250812.1 hypothetical protein [Streptomyces sp. ZSW22]
MRKTPGPTPSSSAVIKADKRLKGVSTAADSETTSLPPGKSSSCAIKVPALLVTGDKNAPETNTQILNWIKTTS